MIFRSLLIILAVALAAAGAASAEDADLANVEPALKVGGQPLSVQLGGRYYADRPHRGPEWGARFAITLLFPK